MRELPLAYAVAYPVGIISVVARCCCASGSHRHNEAEAAHGSTLCEPLERRFVVIDNPDLESGPRRHF
jgi:hypothetical protein